MGPIRPASPSGTPCPPCTCPCRHKRRTWRSKMTWLKVRPMSRAPLAGATAHCFHSSKDIAGPQVQDLVTVKKEFRAREGREVPGLQNRSAHSESHGVGRGEQISFATASAKFADALQQNEVASHLEDATDIQEGVFPNDDKTQRYGNLLFLLQSEPRHIAHLSRLVSMAEIDSLLQTVMFTIYGNQYESREEHLLLTMFQVCTHLAGYSRTQTR